MQLPTAKTPIEKCVRLSRFTQAMLARFPDNATLVSLGSTLGGATDALAVAQRAYAESVLALIPARVELRFADFLADRCVRSTQRAADDIDGQSKGKIASHVFPSGVTPIVRPFGQSQVTEMQQLEGRLASIVAQWPGAAAQQGKVADARQRYERALTARRNALVASAGSHAVRDAAREDFLDAFAQVAGRVKAEFPRDRAMQDLFFDRVVSSDDGDDDDDGDGGAGTPTEPTK
jgi:hypothetical protein